MGDCFFVSGIYAIFVLSKFTNKKTIFQDETKRIYRNKHFSVYGFWDIHSLDYFSLKKNQNPFGKTKKPSYLCPTINSFTKHSK